MRHWAGCAAVREGVDPPKGRANRTLYRRPKRWSNRDVILSPPSPLPPTPVPPISYAGALFGPDRVKVGQTVTLYARADVPPATLCYQHGTSSKQCVYSKWGFWELRIKPSRDQYFTLRVAGKVYARLVYRNVD
jgi:hypothetical protein